MGHLLYGTPPTSVEIDDRTLAHLQVVIINKFRRDERFSFTIDPSAEHGRGRHALWLNPAIPLQFQFAGSRQPTLNPAWIDALMENANGGGGLRVTAEPHAEPVQIRSEPAA
ncbi:ATP-dependent DNA ligase [Microbacteriaceae bacterium VKM Ac-2855]|nr:ATP-dependent DNA ligase [Microbacteriaceae bacterium VKM Ac-2855]